MSSLHNGSGYYGLRDEDNDTLSREHFRTVMAGGGDTTAVFSRTGYLGFVKKSDKPDKNGGWQCVVSLHVCVYVCVCLHSYTCM